MSVICNHRITLETNFNLNSIFDTKKSIYIQQTIYKNNSKNKLIIFEKNKKNKIIDLFYSIQ